MGRFAGDTGWESSGSALGTVVPGLKAELLGGRRISGRAKGVTGLALRTVPAGRPCRFYKWARDGGDW